MNVASTDWNAWVPIALALPLVSFVVSFWMGPRYGWLVPLMATALLLAGWVCTTVILVDHSAGTSHFAVPWFSLGTDVIPIGWWLSPRSVTMLWVVYTISLLVHVYSIGYMAGEGGIARYFAWLGFFTFAMGGLVVSSNLLVTFCCWELVGLSSYRLIGHWHQQPAAGAAATKAFLVNRLGDIGLLVALMLLWSRAGTLDMPALTAMALSEETKTAVGLCVLLALAGKSAQFPLLHWLPDAMAGPTPVSALIHAATMVAAGVYLFVQLHFLFSADALAVAAVVGLLTLFVGGWGALTQFDVKKILAYSTISQLGLMVAGVALASPEAGFAHLFTHAFFKAGLFLGAGALIHAVSRHGHAPQQDIRHMGGLWQSHRLVLVCFAVCAASLAGMPLTSGFLSKEGLLLHVRHHSFYFGVMATASFVTTLYSARMVFYLLSPTPQAAATHPVPAIMQLPLFVLSVGSLFIGLSASPLSIQSWWPVFDAIESAPWVMVVSLAVLVVGVGVAWRLYRHRPTATLHARWVPQTWLDAAQKHIAVTPALQASRLTHHADRRWLDGVLHAASYGYVTCSFVIGWVDRVLIDGWVTTVTHAAKGGGKLFRSLVNGKIQSYLAWGMLALLSFMVWMLYQLAHR
ncbi:MAG: NADH-quinone oxidoreductase subunit L [Cyclobacteriaceae bacterium]|nr:NADH-quinone oxidoreductase subunit L [Cyclobacteriaceae bacterium]